jgi:hypothetical protein
MPTLELERLPGVKIVRDKNTAELFARAVEQGRQALKKGIEERKKREERDRRNWSAFRF